MSVGIDIGAKTIKIVELAREGGRFRLKASGIVSHKGKSPDQMIEDREFALLAEAIKKLYKEAKVSSKEVAIALPETQVYTRTVRFPNLTDSEIASAVRWEAEQYIPIPVSESIVQYQIIERKESSSQVVVLLVAVLKSVVEKYVKVIGMAGLNTVFAETELIALVRALAPDDLTSLIVDLGARSTNIAISKNAQLVFSRSIPTAGEAFTRALSQSLGIPEMQAEEYKRTYGLTQSQLEGKIKYALEPIFKIISDEIKKAIHFYQSEEKGDVPTSVILSGGTAGMPEIASSLTKLLGIEVVVGNPFSKVEIDPDTVKSIAGYAPFYSTSVGLAMRT